jgi:putative ABC transport system substrate-binding protein
MRSGTVCVRLGWVEGQNLAMEYQWAEGKFDRLSDLAADLVERKVDVIVTTTGIAARAAKQATSTIPIVFMAAADALALELVASLARPGGNVTGVTFLATDLSGKRLELLKEAIPSVSHVAVLRCPIVAGQPNLADGPQWRETQAAARGLGIHLQSLEVQGPDDLESALEAATRDRADALLQFDCPILNLADISQRVVALAVKSRLPGMHRVRGDVVTGGLMAYWSNTADAWRRVPTLVDKILKGRNRRTCLWSKS